MEGCQCRKGFDEYSIGETDAAGKWLLGSIAELSGKWGVGGGGGKKGGR